MPELNKYILANSSFDIPIEIIWKIDGSDKPVLLCEGTQNSFDYLIYGIIFGEKFEIVPLDSWTKIKSRSDDIQKIVKNKKIIAIIDNDNTQDKKIPNSIFMTPKEIITIESVFIYEKFLNYFFDKNDSQIIIQNYKKEVEKRSNLKNDFKGSIEKAFKTINYDLDNLKIEIKNKKDNYEFKELLIEIFKNDFVEKILKSI